MKIRDFQDLFVWQKAHRLVLDIYQLTKEFPDVERFGLISQIRRSSVSVCANVAEGHRKSTKEFTRYLDIATGSLEETKYYLILSRDLNYCSYDKFDKFIGLVDEIGKMLSTLIQRLKFKANLYH